MLKEEKELPTPLSHRGSEDRKTVTPASKQPQDSSNKTPSDADKDKPVAFPPIGDQAEDSINLDDFSFADLPQEEVELRGHFNRFIEQMQLSEAVLQKRQQLVATRQQSQL